MTRWEGFRTFEHPGNRVQVYADFGGSDDEPIPLASIRQVLSTAGTTLLRDVVELTETELRWLVDEVAPHVLKRMGERP